MGSAKSDKYHYPGCSGAQKIKSANLVAFSSSAGAGRKDMCHAGYVIRREVLEMKAVIDRIEGELAVLLVGDKERLSSTSPSLCSRPVPGGRCLEYLHRAGRCGDRADQGAGLGPYGEAEEEGPGQDGDCPGSWSLMISIPHLFLEDCLCFG